MRLIHSTAELDAFAGAALVPTMGALHDGHGSLIRLAADEGRPVLVSVFVNPTQFAPSEDFERYPRTLESDLEIAARWGAAAVFAPSADAIYPSGLAAAREQAAALPLPAVATRPGLEDRLRPGHFAGVCGVVARLFDLCRPGVAAFGEKDFQQLLVIESLVRMHPGRWPGLRILRGRTVREEDGLAMSSRNRYLSPPQREQALGLSRALQAAHAAQHPATAEAIMAECLAEHGLEVEYAVVRDAASLESSADFARPCRALIAARLPSVRLIDNAPMTVWR
jgi:pantoate--beta-alanine ligase